MPTFWKYIHLQSGFCIYFSLITNLKQAFVKTRISSNILFSVLIPNYKNVAPQITVIFILSLYARASSAPAPICRFCSQGLVILTVMKLCFND